MRVRTLFWQVPQLLQTALQVANQLISGVLGGVMS